MLAALADGVREAGRYTLQWNGGSAEGTVVPAGIYFVHLSTDAVTTTRKLLYLR